MLTVSDLPALLTNLRQLGEPDSISPRLIMPRNVSTKQPRIAGDVDITAGRGAGQMGWYRFASGFVTGKTVLDVGAGIGRGADLFANIAKTVTKQDIDPQVRNLGVTVRPLNEFETDSFDVVTAIDVVEHIEEDRDFVNQICRIAAQICFVTTPLHNFRRDFWPFHIREYGFREFYDLVVPFGHCSFYIGTSNGSAVYSIANVDWFFFMERMINNEITNLPTRAIQKILPKSKRFNSHQAVMIVLD